MVEILDGTRIERLTGSACDSPRARAHDCFHPRESDPVQRMVVALEPATQVTPHRHPGEDRWEMLVLLQGRLALLLFDDQGRVGERVELAADGVRIAEFDGADWHALVALEPGTVMLEVKRGPYHPPADEDFAVWAPREQQPGADALREWLRGARVGEVYRPQASR